MGLQPRYAWTSKTRWQLNGCNDNNDTNDNNQYDDDSDISNYKG